MTDASVFWLWALCRALSLALGFFRGLFCALFRVFWRSTAPGRVPASEVCAPHCKGSVWWNGLEVAVDLVCLSEIWMQTDVGFTHCLRVALHHLCVYKTFDGKCTLYVVCLWSRGTWFRADSCCYQASPQRVIIFRQPQWDNSRIPVLRHCCSRVISSGFIFIQVIQISVGECLRVCVLMCLVTRQRHVQSESKLLYALVDVDDDG